MPSARVGVNEVYFEVHGEGPRTPVVLVMGLGADAHGWERQLPVLARDRKVLVLDNRGIGRSAKPAGPYTTAELADDVVGVMDATDIARAHVIGISLGGMIAQEIALRHPERVVSLALLATFGRADEEAHQRADQGAAQTGGGLNLAAAMAAIGSGGAGFDFRQVFRFMMPLVFSPGFLERERDYLRAFLTRSEGYGLSSEGFVGQVVAALKHDALDRLATLTIPTLIVTGTKDKLVSPRHSRRLAQVIAGARLVEIEGGSHGLNLEHADELNVLLAGWLGEQDQR